MRLSLHGVARMRYRKGSRLLLSAPKTLSCSNWNGIDLEEVLQSVNWRMFVGSFRCRPASSIRRISITGPPTLASAICCNAHVRRAASDGFAHASAPVRSPRRALVEHQWRFHESPARKHRPGPERTEHRSAVDRLLA